MLDRFARRVVGHPRLVFAIVGLITAFFAVGLLRIRIDSSAGTLVDRESPGWAYYEDVTATFGSDETDVVAILADDVFNAATLAKVDALTTRLLHVEGVADVVSLATARNLTATPDGEIDRSPVMAEPPTDRAAIEELRGRIHDNPLLNGTLVAEGDHAAAIFVTYEQMTDREMVASGVHDRIEELLREFEGPEELLFSGVPRIKVEAAKLILDDVLRLGPLSFLVVSVVLFLSFRSWRGTLLPALTTGTGTIWTIGLMGFLDAPINIITLVLPTFLLAVGNAYTTHIVARHHDELEVDGDPVGAARRTIAQIGTPVLATALTTVLGFGALLVYHIEAIRDLGLFAVFGITSLFLLALTFAPAALSLLPAPPPRQSSAREQWLQRALEGLGRFSIEHSKGVGAAALVLVAVFAWGVRHLDVETTYLSYFPKDDPVRRAAEGVNEYLGLGDAAFFVVIDGPEADSITRLSTLHRIAALQDYIERVPQVKATTSIVDYVKLLHRTLHDNDPAYYGLPDTDAAVAQFMLLLDPGTLGDVLSGDSSRAAILVRSNIHVSATMNALVRKIEQFAADGFPPPFSVRVTGTRVLFDRTADDLAAGQVGSLVAALAVVFAVLTVQFLSPRFGLVAMGPNLVPIVVFFGILGWSSTPLGMATAMIAAIALGVGVDEAVHLLADFNDHVRKTADQHAAAIAALRGVGPPLVYSAVSLFFGVMVLLASNFVPLQQFGLFTGINVAGSLLTDLILLPAILASTRFVTIWDALALKLGGAPQQSIPLFHGLTAAEARIAVLMGVLKDVGQGEKITVQGDTSEGMYVLIRGRARIERGVKGNVTVLREIGRGDVVGEMGLVRRAPRTADVIALEDCELLMVDDNFLHTLKERYPRIAATLLFNLTHILSDRLDTAEQQHLE
jgi:predicted RND superfamily exporter protein